jgi:hypothetical protein
MRAPLLNLLKRLCPQAGDSHEEIPPGPLDHGLQFGLIRVVAIAPMEVDGVLDVRRAELPTARSRKGPSSSRSLARASSRVIAT